MAEYNIEKILKRIRDLRPYSIPHRPEEIDEDIGVSIPLVVPPPKPPDIVIPVPEDPEISLLPPIIISLSASLLPDEEPTFSVTVVAVDPDGDDENLLYEWESSEGIESFQNNVNNFATVVWKAPIVLSQSSDIQYELFVTVTDEDKLYVKSDALVITILFEDPDIILLPPVITELSAEPSSISSEEETKVTVVAHDPDGDDINLIYQWQLEDGSFPDVSFPDGSNFSVVTWKAPTVETNNEDHDLFVVVTDEDKLSVKSDALTITVSPYLPPDAPEVPTVEPGDDHTRLNISWEEPEDNGSDIFAYLLEYKKTSEDDTQYRGIYLGVEDIDLTIYEETTPTSLETTITGLEEDTQYDVRVYAENQADDNVVRRGVASPVGQGSTSLRNRPPSIISFVTVPVNVKVTGTSELTLRATDPDNDTITFVYTFVDENGDELSDTSAGGVGSLALVSNNATGGVTTNVQEYEPPGEQTTIYIKVVASDTDRGSETLEEFMNPSAIVTINVICDRPDAPDRPDVNTVDDNEMELEVEWVEPEDNGCPITGYQLEYRIASEISSTTILLNGTATTHTIDDLTRNNTYQVRVQAGNTIDGVFGYGDWSDIGEGQTKYINNAPVIVSFTADPPSILLDQISTLTVIATDEDGDDLEYSFSVATDELTDEGHFSSDVDLLGAHQQFYHPPDEIGTYTVTVTVTDNPGNTLNVPEGTEPISVEAMVDIEVSDVVCRSPDAPTGVTVEAVDHRELLIVWSPPTSNGGSEILDYNIEYVTTADLDGNPIWEVNGTTVGINVDYTDPEPAIEGLQTRVSVENLNEATRYYFRIAAGNDCNGDGTVNFGDWSAHGAGNTNNIGPTCMLTPSGAIMRHRNTETEFSAGASSDVVTWEWGTTGGTFDTVITSEGERVWIAPNEPGLYSVTVTVRDAGNPPVAPTPLFASCTTNIVVENQVPFFEEFSDDQVGICGGDRVDLYAIANDDDSLDVLALSFEWDFDEGSGIVSNTSSVANGRRSDFEWFAPNTPGEHTITVVVTDGIESVTQDIIITVNYPPTISITVDDDEVECGETTTVRATVTDQDNDGADFSFTWNTNTGSFEGVSSVDGTGRYIRTWRAPERKGTAELSVTVSDGCASITSNSVNVTIPNTAPDPSITPRTSVVAPGDIQQLVANPNDKDGDPVTFAWEITEGGGVLEDSDGIEITSGGTNHPQIVFYRAPGIT